MVMRLHSPPLMSLHRLSSRVWLVLVALLGTLSTSLSLASEGGTHGGGGGNVFVCFAASSPWPAKLRAGTNGRSAVAVPDDALGDVQSIEMLDLYFARENLGSYGITGHFRNDGLLPLKVGKDLDADFMAIASRYRETIPPIYNDLMRAASKLPVSIIVWRPQPLDQIDDFTDWKNPHPSCVISTMINQFDDYSWHIDQRLFNHPKHTDLSRAVAMFHERTYWLVRQAPEFYNVEASRIYDFVTASLLTATTYDGALRAFNGMFFDSQNEFYSVSQTAPGALKFSIIPKVIAEAGGPSSSLPSMLQIYKSKYRPLLMASPFDAKLKAALDGDITFFFKTGQMISFLSQYFVVDRPNSFEKTTLLPPPPVGD